jgi:hypothetical protein
MFKFCKDCHYCNYASWLWILAWKYAHNVNRSWQRLAKCTVCINHSCRLFSSKIPFFLTNEVNKNLLVSLTTHWTSLTLFFVDKHQLHYLIHCNIKQSGIVWNKIKIKESGYPPEILNAPDQDVVSFAILCTSPPNRYPLCHTSSPWFFKFKSKGKKLLEFLILSIIPFRQ